MSLIGDGIGPPHVRKSKLRNPGKIFLGLGIQNTTQGIRNPTNDWNPKSKFSWQRQESSSWHPESVAWNPGWAFPDSAPKRLKSCLEICENVAQFPDSGLSWIPLHGVKPPLFSI